ADSTAMGSSAEHRLPFLDRDLVEFALHLPSRMRAVMGPGLYGTKVILRRWARKDLPGHRISRRKRSFNYGSLRALLALRGEELRGLVLGAGAVRRALPGLEAWLRRPDEVFHGPWEGTLWALLALAVWCVAAGIE